MINIFVRLDFLEGLSKGTTLSHVVVVGCVYVGLGFKFYVPS